MLAWPVFAEGASAIGIISRRQPSPPLTSLILLGKLLSEIFWDVRRSEAGCGSTPVTQPNSPTLREQSMACNPKSTPPKRIVSPGFTFLSSNQRDEDSYSPVRIRAYSD